MFKQGLENYRTIINKLSYMLILHDSPSTDLSHIQALADIEEGFALFDYVRINQIRQDNQAEENNENNLVWIGQIVQPNQNISVVGNRLDPTILHGLNLMQSHSNVQSVESVQVFDILILGQYDGRQLLTSRIRPLPGAEVERLDTETTIRVIGIPSQVNYENGTNVIGELLNADDVPLCISEEKFNYHIMIAGGTGSGKSNVAANLIDQGLKFGKCVLIHDAKPDYGLVAQPNSDPNVESVWELFYQYNLEPHGADNLVRIGFHGRCEPDQVDHVVGFRASDFDPEMLASLFFTGSSSAEQNGFEGFAASANALSEQIQSDDRSDYSLDDILNEVQRRSQSNIDPNEAIHELTGRSILRKVNSRRRNMPWLDVVGNNTGQRSRNRLQGSSLDGNNNTVRAFDINQYIQRQSSLVIDYSRMDEQSYALILSYFLRICHQYRQRLRRDGVGIVQMVDEAHRIFDNRSRYGGTLSANFSRVMREGRSLDHSIILSLQNASQIPGGVMNNLNSQIVMYQNGKEEADAATQTMGREFSVQSRGLGAGQALVRMYESRATVLAQMAPSPYELMREDNTGSGTNSYQRPRRDTDDRGYGNGDSPSSSVREENNTNYISANLPDITFYSDDELDDIPF